MINFKFPECLFPRGKYDLDRMRLYALIISWVSIVYNGFEGGVSIGFGIDSASRALIAFGVQSIVEVLSAGLVIYRFRYEFSKSGVPNIELERRATFGIGILFVILSIGTWVASIVGLVMHEEPDSSKPSLIVAACSLFCMIIIWLPKPWIAIELDSSVMRGESACSLACIYLTIVLLIGSLIYRLWDDGWWVDSAIAIVLGFFFLYQGYDMIVWSQDKNFNGGCCKKCSSPTSNKSTSDTSETCSDNKTCTEMCDSSA